MFEASDTVMHAGLQGAEQTDDLRLRQLKFLGLDEDMRDDLRKSWPMIEGQLPHILADFYSLLAGQPDMAAFLDNGPGMEVLKSAQAAHWRRLFDGNFNEEYFANTIRIGNAHERIGLEPTWYVTGYSFILCRLVSRQLEDFKSHPKKAARRVASIIKAVTIDMALGIEAYFDAMEIAKQKRTALLAHDFEESVKRSVEGVRKSVTALNTAATAISGIAGQMRERAETADDAARSASSAMQMMATAATELSASVDEIGRQTSQSAMTARANLERATEASAVIGVLRQTVNQIGDVSALIRDIAGQTNMLALNATIEAARAGVAGKGFAVVAGEVKSLAGQTARASTSITKEVGSVHQVSGQVAKAVEMIGADITGMGEATAAIASAVEEQGAATAEISRAATTAAVAGNTVERVAHSLLQNAKDCDQASADLLGAASALAGMAEEVSLRVDDFLANLRH